MDIQSTLIGLGLLAGVVVIILAGIAGINAWEKKHDDGNAAHAQ